MDEVFVLEIDFQYKIVETVAHHLQAFRSDGDGSKGQVSMLDKGA